MKNKPHFLNAFLFLVALFSSINFSAFSQHIAIVELFTSEGCSSCPPADDLLNKISKEAEVNKSNVWVLAFHVDYWNKLGWKDPYSKFQFTTRQENYSRVLAEKQVYTPQAVINGNASCVGSKESTVRSLIKDGLNTSADTKVEIKKDSVSNDTLYISYVLSKSGQNYSLRFALTEDGLSSKVAAGENEGKTLHHENVVRVFTSVDSPDEKGVYKIPLKGIKLSERIKLTVFLQHKQTMKIIGAQRIRFY